MRAQSPSISLRVNSQAQGRECRQAQDILCRSLTASDGDWRRGDSGLRHIFRICSINITRNAALRRRGRNLI